MRIKIHYIGNKWVYFFGKAIFGKIELDSGLFWHFIDFIASANGKPKFPQAELWTNNSKQYIWGTHKTNLSPGSDILKAVLCCKIIRFYATIYTKSLRNSSTFLQNGTNNDGSKYIWNSNNPFCYGITKCDSRHWKLPLSFSHGQLEMQTRGVQKYQSGWS